MLGGGYIVIQFKIISNPYDNTIEFKQRNPSAELWETINPDSELHSDKYSDSNKVVFPFVVKNILDVIVSERTEDIDLFFEGTEDEYDDLAAICTKDAYPQITLKPLQRMLLNARDIRKEVETIYTEQILPLSDRNIRSNSELNQKKKQFMDVSKKVIPLCILGNYSSGKSSFINALIGAEILPTGDKATTGKIHRIENSKEAGEATISFRCGDEYRALEIKFRDDSVQVPESFGNSPLLAALNDSLRETSEQPLAFRINQILQILNKPDSDVSELIEIRFPFYPDGVLGSSSNTYAIFDTPGSNAGSHADHAAIMRQALENLSNGLPIYVAVSTTLSTMDNKALCDMLGEMPQVDTRYTMIVVNKADDADLPDEYNEEWEKGVLSETLPDKLYRGGLYYVSSVMGLGSKIGDHFAVKKYGKTFRKNEDDYREGEELCCQLYQFDILPSQIKAVSIEESKREANRIYANSGLYWIEREIENFADKYSPYNKFR